MKFLLNPLLIKHLLQLGLKAGSQNSKPKYILWRILAGLLLLIAVIFLLIGAHTWLISEYGALYAHLIFAAGFAGIAVLILIIVAIARYRHKRKSALQSSLDQVDDFTQQVKGQAQEMGAQIQKTLRDHQGKALLAAAIVGILLGRRK
ncbi:phage holin family protein [Suttonella sp. R2A3]|uniref:phage holin family protein n=1 Tax=Suttonella sp. R2A3 TaxID=2908648 RepID=UPI001F34EE28|nr:phage holin family protein [Suttonella sp. R2A3]UJF24594.1 phage holin family protein [Suttonella sp. R2A3]